MKSLKNVKEFFKFFFSWKRVWLLPVILFLLIIGALVTASSHAIIAPFIYTIF